MTETPSTVDTNKPATTILRLGHVIAVLCALLAAFCVAWEIWLAPIRPGAWTLALKSLPLWWLLPGLARGRIRSFQWLSLLILAYLAEGLVRATSDIGAGVALGWWETALSAVIFGLTLYYCAGRRRLGLVDA